jgi:5-methylcytosine-specific restriction endonuclease McrA
MNGTKANAIQLRQLIERQSYKCALSGMPLEPDTATLDHIVPISYGGNDAVENLQWLHQDVNRMKGTMNQSDFLRIVRLISQWTR